MTLGNPPVEDKTDALPKFVRIRIKSGEHAGVYVGETSGFPISGASKEYFLHPEARLATNFVDYAAPSVQAELKVLGYESELVEVAVSTENRLKAHPVDPLDKR